MRAVPAILVLLVPLLVPSAAGSWAQPVTTRARAAPTGYWHTAGTGIVDAAGRPVRSAGVTWYGMESGRFAPAGLEFQRYTTILDLVKLLGYNTIRLPFSNELVERDPIVTRGLTANPGLRGLHGLQILDAIVAYAGRIGLKIILDDQRSEAPRPMAINGGYPPLWYDGAYPESAWIRDWQILARRYRGDDTVIGVDLRNEPHPASPGPWTLQTYLREAPTWGPYRGVEHAVTDWRLAAERAGNAILAINPHLLIIVQGLALYPAAGRPGGMISSWWAGLLISARRYPVRLAIPHQLVYSVHEWGPHKGALPWFHPLSYASLTAAWHRDWSFLLDHPRARYAAPVLLGEFGTCTETPDCVSSSRPDSQGLWFRLVLRFLRSHPRVQWSFFALNGTNANRCATDNGLLGPRWNTLANSALQAALRRIQPSPGLSPPAIPGPLLPGTGTRRRPRNPASPLCRLP